MAVIDFPLAPADGQVFQAGNGARYRYQAPPGLWAADAMSIGGSGGVSVVTSDTPPSTPSDGDLWWNSTLGKLFVYYDDGSSLQWVPATPISASSGGVDVRAFGAAGNGTTDDSAAIQNANAAATAAGKTLWFPDGVYAVNALTMTVGWSMALNAKLLYIGAASGECVRCSATGLKSGNIYIDCNGREPLTGLYIDGSTNYFESVKVENAVSTDQVWVVRSVYILGNNNTFGELRFEKLLNTGNTNDSSPQSLVMSGTATGNSFGSVYGINTRSVVVDNSSGRNSYGEVHAVDCKDNGFYCVGVGCNAHIGALFYDGDNDGFGARHDANCTIGQVHILRAGNFALFFGDCGDITIGDILIHDNAADILHLNGADTGKIKIGSIRGSVRNTLPFFLTTENGTVEYLSIGDVDVTVTLDASFSGSTFSILRFDACRGIDLGRFKVNVILNGFVTVNPFWARFATTLAYHSRLDSFRVGIFEADGVTPTGSFRALGMASSTTPLVQDKLMIGEGVLDTTSALLPYTTTGYHPGRLVSAAIPTTGTWRAGAVVWAQAPTAGVKFWICTAAGTPGTWTT